MGPEVVGALLELPPPQRLEEMESIVADPEYAPLLLATDRKEVITTAHSCAASCWPLRADAAAHLLLPSTGQLLVQKAVAMSQLGRAAAAAEAWTNCLRFATSCLPPNDESGSVYAVQAAVCHLHAATKAKAMAANDDDGEEGEEGQAAAHVEAAHEFLAHALGVHGVCFGGGAFVMAMRYKAELLDAPPFFPEACAKAWGIIAAATESFRQYD